MNVRQLTAEQREELIEDLLALKDVVPIEGSCPPVRNDSRREIYFRGGLGLNNWLCPPLHLPLLDFSKIIFERKK